jgi:type IV pilus assembly protein PilE
MKGYAIIKKLSQGSSFFFNSFLFTKKLKGDLLMQVLIVLLIIGILVTMAAPKLIHLISDARSTEAKTHLNFIFTLEKTYFYKNSQYSVDLNSINYEQPKLSTEGGNANYKYEISQATNNTFKARATAVKDFDGDGVYNVWEINDEQILNEVTPD